MPHLLKKRTTYNTYTHFHTANKSPLQHADKIEKISKSLRALNWQELFILSATSLSSNLKIFDSSFALFFRFRLLFHSLVAPLARAIIPASFSRRLAL